MEGYKIKALPSSYINGFNNIFNTYYLFDGLLPDIVFYAYIDKANFLYSVFELNAFSASFCIKTAHFLYNAPGINFNKVLNFLQSALFFINSLTCIEYASLLFNNLMNFKIPKVGKVYSLYKALYWDNNI